MANGSCGLMRQPPKLLRRKTQRTSERAGRNETDRRSRVRRRLASQARRDLASVRLRRSSSAASSIGRVSGGHSGERAGKDRQARRGTAEQFAAGRSALCSSFSMYAGNVRRSHRPATGWPPTCRASRRSSIPGIRAASCIFASRRISFSPFWIMSSNTPWISTGERARPLVPGRGRTAAAVYTHGGRQNRRNI